jgi:hypothetical protein
VLLEYWNDDSRLETSVLLGSCTPYSFPVNNILKKMLARRDPFLLKAAALQMAINNGNEDLRVMIQTYNI